MDDRLAETGLDGAALHEVAPAATFISDGAAATLFVTGIAASFASNADAGELWVVSRFDLYAPGLEQAGLAPSRIIFAKVREDKEVLALMEDALRHGGLAAVVDEVKRADMTAARRLQLAAGTGKTPALLARCWRRQGYSPLSDISAVTTRWRIACAPSERLPAPGGRMPHWVAELVRQRDDHPFSLVVEACDDTGRLTLPAGARDRADPGLKRPRVA